MRTLFGAACLAAASLLVMPAAVAQQSASQRVEDPAALIALSGLDSVFDTLDSEFKKAAGAEDLELPPELQTAWSVTATWLQLGETLSAEMARGLDLALDDSEVVEIASFYQAPLGRRLVAAEREALGPEADALIASEGETLRLEMQRQPERWAELETIIANSGSADIGVEIFSSMMFALLSGISAAEGAFEQLTRADIEAAVADEVETLRPELEIDVRRSVAYTYRDFSIMELRVYNDFLSSRAGRKFFAVTIGVFGRTLADEMHRFGQGVAKALKQKDI